MISLRRTLLAASFALVTSSALAQQPQGPRDRQTRSLITNAMEDYQNLEIDRAVERLQIALRGCANSACSPQVVARVQMALGIVAVGGQQNTDAGIEAMVRALQLDANAEPDPLMVTPEISAAFRQAQSRAQRGGGATTGNTGATGNTGTTGNTRPPPRGSAELLHTPAAEQLENTPLPVYVEGNGGLSAEHVYVYFRGNGMRAFERREMTRVANGWGTEIPCANIIQGNVEYYVQAQDASGAALASAGSEGSPVQVSIVTRRTAPAPALPGRMPPETCAGGMDECPPGMTGPQCRPRGGGGARRGGLGDACTSNSDCGEGMRCDGGACSASEGGSSGEPTEPSTPSNEPRFTRFSVDLGGGIGLAYLSGGPAITRTGGDGVMTGRVTNIESVYAEYRAWSGVNPATGMREVRGNCPPNIVCSATISSGFAPTGYLATVIRYNITRRFGVGLGVRFQFDAAPWDIPAPAPPTANEMVPNTTRSNLFANLLLNLRGYVALTPNGFVFPGFVASAFVGGGVGQISPTPSLPARVTQSSGHILSGLGNIVVGTRVEYGFKRTPLHVGAEVAFQFMLPTFLFNIDITPFIGIHI